MMLRPLPIVLATLTLLTAAPPRSFAQDDAAPAAEEEEEAEEEEAKEAEDDDPYQQIAELANVIELVRRSYVDGDKVTYDQLIEGALEGMLASLDPHCEYMRQSLFEDLQHFQESTYDGIGVGITTKSGELSAVTVRDGGPASRAGMLPGDRFVKIDDIFTEDVGIAEAIGLLDGRPGEEITIAVRRPSTRELLSFTMTREVLHQDTVVDACTLPVSATGDHRFGYARMTQFSDTTARELADALDELESEEGGLDGFIFDLRNNPGGLLTAAVEVCAEFLPEDTLVVTIEGRAPSMSAPPFKTGPRLGNGARDFPVVVLVNYNSASAAEIVSGALQDLRRAIVVGETTFGKGSVQSVIPVEGGGALRLTTAKYYTPSHKVIHENGVTPDIIVPATDEEEASIGQFRSRQPRPEELGRTLAKLGDSQLDRAVDSLIGAIALGLGSEGEEE